MDADSCTNSETFALVLAAVFSLLVWLADRSDDRDAFAESAPPLSEFELSAEGFVDIEAKSGEAPPASPLGLAVADR